MIYLYSSPFPVVVVVVVVVCSSARDVNVDTCSRARYLHAQPLLTPSNLPSTQSPKRPFQSAVDTTASAPTPSHLDTRA
ncbi:uncharacterized protein B0I36DRAFT_890 [Microdochium trichocladiopsis]|uniref:Secreted protein n=1 Tax=Microdochium trichocladiopsis TaxID=1682393 RepID=A0A9P9BT66_9PEZI|nr:uncharacterized protein B0I36DRAFT_890 [Microdochium trichocladiopsis]KAH7039656.1 hypothetical protein B0I36DRAFT_890 [Microdochium trichocladiopsis]